MSASSEMSTPLSANFLTQSWKVGRTQHPVKVLGVCGGIGSGKSAACQLLVSELSCVAHIDTDSIAHTVYKPGSQVVEEVVQEFGPDILLEATVTTSVREIDRKKLGAVVFGNPTAMRKLELIVWPHVQREIEQRIATIRNEWQTNNDNNNNSLENGNKLPVIVVEAAVLLDAGWQDSFLDGVWVVTVPHEVAIRRITETRGLSIPEAERRIEAQQSRRGIGNIHEELKKKVVTATIDNSGSLEDLKQALWAKLMDETAWYEPDR